MEFHISPGRYVLAVSGGVDSMVLLDLMYRMSDIQLIIAHYDHGIRADSVADRQLVQSVAEDYRLSFVYEEGSLGRGISEAAARTARYTFLEQVRARHNADAIITAHHEDDVLETAIINMIRGTGRRGLTALGNTVHRVRPLLHTPKADILRYAVAHNLSWHEDSTNQDERYLRNYVRLRILPRFDTNNRAKFVQILETMRVKNKELDMLLGSLIENQIVAPELERRWFIALPHAVSREVLATWLRVHGISGFDTYMLERLIISAKTLRPGATIDVLGGVVLAVRKDTLALLPEER